MNGRRSNARKILRSGTLLTGLLVGILFASADGIAQVQTTPEEKVAIGQAVEVCRSTLNDSSTRAAEEQLSSLEALIQQRLAEKASQPTRRAQTDEPRNVAPGAEAGPPALTPQQLKGAQFQLDQLKEQMQLARSIRSQAASRLDQVTRAPNAAAAQVLLREAQGMIAQARTMERRVVDDLAPGSSRTAPVTTPDWSHRSFRSEAFEQLKASAASRDLAEGRIAFGESGKLTPQDALAYNDRAETLTLSDGSQIDVSTLRGSFASQARPGTSLFVPTPPAAGMPSAVRLSPSVSRAIREVPKPGDSPRVGGVALEVTLDLLNFLEVPDFRNPGPALVVERPVMVSLKRLGSEAAQYIENWNQLPDRLRYPGNMNRLIGFVLEPASADVLLVGSRATSGQPRIELDSLIIALRSVWRDGLTPAVSLDPAPADPGGPQYSRIIGLPGSSQFAKTMLDADYAMKRIMANSLKTGAGDFRSMTDLLLASPSGSDAQSHRFWFYPTPMGAGDLLVSRTGQTVLFNSAIELLTEGQRLVDGGYVAAGTVDPVAEQAARNFTAAFDAFEGDQNIQPAGIFLRLHALVDLVTACQIWRKFDVDYPVLGQIANLPVRELFGPAAPPLFYYGVNLAHVQGNMILTTTGGAVARVRAGRHAVSRRWDGALASLEREGAKAATSSAIATEVDVSFTLPRAGRGSDAVARQFAVGMAALDERSYSAAKAAFREATRLDPVNAEAWARLAQSELGLGETAKAKLDIGRALSLSPLDVDYRKLALDLAMSADPETAVASADLEIRRLLSVDYGERARVQRILGRRFEAARMVNLALRLWEDNGDAYYERALLLSSPSRQQADMTKAIDLYRRDYERRPLASTAMPLALALLHRALIETDFIDIQEIADGIMVDSGLRRIKNALDDVQEAQKATPDNPLLYSVRGQLMQMQILMTEASGVPGLSPEVALRPIDELADEYVQRFPNLAGGYLLKASVLELRGRSTEAIRLYDEALKRDPINIDGLGMRATAKAEAGRCSEARSDAARAMALSKGDPSYRQPELLSCS